MKKVLSLILALVLCLSLCACGDGSANPTTTSSTEQSTKPLSAIEQLTEKEHCLFDAIVKMTTKDFYEPSEIRVLEIGDYDERTKWDEDDYLYGPDTVVVRLQGENRVGGTLNHYYLVCTAAGENMTELGQSHIEYERLFGSKEKLLRYKGEVGDYAELSDTYRFEKSATDIFNIGRINKALKEYWEEMGF